MARRGGTNHRETLTNRGSRFLGEVPLLPVFLPLVSCQEGFAVGGTAAWTDAHSGWRLLGPSRACGCGTAPRLRAGVGKFKLIKTLFVHSFWTRKCLTACFTHRAEQAHSASVDRAPDERNECFVYDRFLFLFPRFRSKLLQKCRQNLQYLPQNYSSSSLGAADQHVKDSS